MNKIQTKDFNLAHTITSNQIFRYEFHDGYYYINASNRLFKVKQIENELLFNGVSKKFITEFFNLDQNIKPILKTISKDKHIHKAINHASGLRLIKQTPWECLISHIVAHNTSLKKTKEQLDHLSRMYGDKVFLDHVRSHTFPKCGSLQNLERLSQIKGLDKADLIHQANYIVTEQFFDLLKDMDHTGAHDQLIKLNGVNSPIANAVLVSSLGHTHAFPLTKQTKSVIQKIYFPKKKASIEEMHQFAQDYWGEHAGYAQLYLNSAAKQLVK